MKPWSRRWFELDAVNDIIYVYIYIYICVCVCVCLCIDKIWYYLWLATKSAVGLKAQIGPNTLLYVSNLQTRTKQTKNAVKLEYMYEFFCLIYKTHRRALSYNLPTLLACASYFSNVCPSPSNVWLVSDSNRISEQSVWTLTGNNIRCLSSQIYRYNEDWIWSVLIRVPYTLLISSLIHHFMKGWRYRLLSPLDATQTNNATAYNFPSEHI